jgi:hypothetical protein
VCTATPPLQRLEVADPHAVTVNAPLVDAGCLHLARLPTLRDLVWSNQVCSALVRILQLPATFCVTLLNFLGVLSLVWSSPACSTPPLHCHDCSRRTLNWLMGYFFSSCGKSAAFYRAVPELV